MQDGAVRVFVAVIYIAVTGCLGAEIESESEVGFAEQAIINGINTDERPEIGIITNSGCTATLVTPRVILTAAHCVDFQTGPRADGFLTGHGEFFAIDFVISRTNSAPGWSDLAVARLVSAVPSSSAVPTPASFANAGSAETVTVYGYGCIDRANPTLGYGTKRKFTYIYRNRWSLGLLCPGDSGGPTILPSRGVFLVNSGYWSDGSDIYASVADNYSWVSSAIDAIVRQ